MTKTLYPFLPTDLHNSSNLSIKRRFLSIYFADRDKVYYLCKQTNTNISPL